LPPFERQKMKEAEVELKYIQDMATRWGITLCISPLLRSIERGLLHNHHVMVIGLAADARSYFSVTGSVNAELRRKVESLIEE